MSRSTSLAAGGWFPRSRSRMGDERRTVEFQPRSGPMSHLDGSNATPGRWPTRFPILRTGGSPPPRDPDRDDSEDAREPRRDIPYPPPREGPFMPDKEPGADPSQLNARGERSWPATMPTRNNRERPVATEGVQGSSPTGARGAGSIDCRSRIGNTPSLRSFDARTPYRKPPTKHGESTPVHRFDAAFWATIATYFACG